MTNERPDILQLTELDNGRLAASNLGDPEVNNVLFGGQILAQMIVAAASKSPDKTVKTISCIFARAGRVDGPTEFEVDTFHAGRAFASHTVSLWQGDRLCARASVLMHGHDDDVISHQIDKPAATAPNDADAVQGHTVFPGGDYIIADGVDLVDSSSPIGPAELSVWYRWTGAPNDPIVNQAALAWGTDGFLIGTAMRPHEGVAYDRAHVDLSTGVVNHTLTFHRPFSMTDWLLMTHEAPFAGGGRSYGRCHIHDAAGTLVASYVQDNMIRAMPNGSGHKGM